MTKTEMLANIFAKCVEINGLEAHDHSDSNRPNVFFNYSGHVSSVGLYWYINGWATGLDRDDEFDFHISRLDGKLYAEIMNKLDELQNHTSEVALDCNIDNLDSIKKLAIGDIFLLKTPIDSLCRGEVVQTDKGRRYKIKGIKGGAEITYATLKRHLIYLGDLKSGVA